MTKKPSKKRPFPTKVGVVKASKKVQSDVYHAMLDIFDAAGVKYRTWALATSPGLQEFDGHYIIIGSSSGDEPYTGFSFDTTGALREVTTVATTSDQQVAVESVGRRTMTIITPFHEGSESRHVTNPEEN